MLLALPFRYRYEINIACEATPGWSGTAYRAAHYESVDERFRFVYSRPDQYPMFAWGPGWTGVNGMQLQPCVQPSEPDAGEGSVAIKTRTEVRPPVTTAHTERL